MSIQTLSAVATIAKLEIAFKDFNSADVSAARSLATQNNANEKRIKVRKAIIDPKSNPAYAALQSARSELRASFYGFTLKYSGDGYRLLPNNSFMEFQTKNLELTAKFEAAADAFCTPRNIDAARQDARLNLGTMFTDELIPDASELRQKYGVEIRRGLIADTAQLSSAKDLTPTVLQQISADMLRQQRADLQDGYRDAFQSLQTALDRLAEALRDYGPGKQLRNSVIENVREISQSLTRLNIFDDPIIGRLATESSNVVAGLTAEPLKSDPKTREYIAAHSASVANDISAEISRLSSYFQ